MYTYRVQHDKVVFTQGHNRRIAFLSYIDVMFPYNPVYSDGILEHNSRIPFLAPVYVLSI